MVSSFFVLKFVLMLGKTLLFYFGLLIYYNFIERFTQYGTANENWNEDKASRTVNEE